MGDQAKEKFIRRSDLPHSGWLLVDVWDTFSADCVCENCNFPHVRYVHELRHKSTGKTVRVGCVCAEHLSQDFATPRLREKALRGLAGRRMRWPTLNWKRSQKGNLYLKKRGLVIVITRAGERWAASYKRSDDNSAEWTPVRGWYQTPRRGKARCFRRTLREK